MTIEVTAKKPEDAIKQGLEQLGATLDEVEVEVLESGGLFRKAKVRLTIDRDEQPKVEEPEKEPKPEKPAGSEKAEKVEKIEKAADKEPEKERAKSDKAQPERSVKKAEKGDKVERPKKADKPEKPEKAEKPEKLEKLEKLEKTPRRTSEEEKQALNDACEFVKTVVGKMGIEANVALDEAKGTINIEAPAGDDSLIIGRHGETLSALAYLAETAERAEKYRINVSVDCNGYRERRAASLAAMARRRADECVNKHRRIKLEAMDRVDRRTIHFALADDDRVTTASEGKEPHRYIVICPKKQG